MKNIVSDIVFCRECNMKWEKIQMESIFNENGRLDVCEFPFSFNRFYVISEVEQQIVRGNHAHKNLSQIFFALSGSFKLKLDDGSSIEVFSLENNGTGVIVKPGVWRELSDFSSQCKCLVFASSHYDPSDYIFNYTEFKEGIKNIE
jgi:hypothetical protein